MSLLNWFASKTKRRTAAARAAPADSAGSRRAETGPGMASRLGRNSRPLEPAPATSRKGERMAKRELLYSVVRECMVRSGVLSSSYTFKVLSLDRGGRQCIMMVDLKSDPPVRLQEIEALIAQQARQRHDLLVKAVYWRVREPQPAQTAPGAAAVPAEAMGAAAVAAPARPEPDVDAVDADELAAFRRALLAGTQSPVEANPPGVRAFDGTAVQGPQSYTLLTGFEDTEMPDERRDPALSATQYGELT